MTVHVHDPAAHHVPSNAAPPGRAAMPRSRPWWVLPAIIGAVVAAALVAAGIVSLNTVLYAGLFVGMMLMHGGSHGHGGHGGHGGDHGAHRASGQEEDLSGRSSAAQDAGSGFETEADIGANDRSTESETNHHDHQSSRGCH